MKSASAITNVNSSIVQLEAHRFICPSLLHMGIFLYKQNSIIMSSTIAHAEHSHLYMKKWIGPEMIAGPEEHSHFHWQAKWMRKTYVLKLGTLIFGNSEDFYSLDTGLLPLRAMGNCTLVLRRHLRSSWNKSIVCPENLWVLHRNIFEVCASQKNRIGIAEERRSESTHGMPEIFSFTCNATSH